MSAPSEPSPLEPRARRIPRTLRPAAVQGAALLSRPLATALRLAARAGGRPGSRVLAASPRRILFVSVAYLGDTILSLPLLRALAARWPEAELDVWCRSRTADLFQGAAPAISNLSQVLVTDAVPTDRTRDSSSSWSRRGALLGHLRRRHHDLAVDSTGVPGTTCALLATGAHCLAGWSNQGLGAAYDIQVAYDVPGEHLYDRRRRLAQALGLELPPAASLGAHLSAWRPSPSTQTTAACQDATLLHLGAGWRAKEWPAAHWGRLAATLAAAGHHPVLHVAPPDRHLITPVLRAAAMDLPVVEAGSIPLLAARLHAARLLIAADSGPAHLAAALGCPTLTLFGPTDPALCAPLAKNAITLRAPGTRMADLAPATVAAAATKQPTSASASTG